MIVAIIETVKLKSWDCVPGHAGTMKAFLTIRGNLLLINVVVIGLLLWLATSFLYLAVVQRAEALQLQANVDAERNIFYASNALATERDKFDNFFNKLNKPTPEQVRQLQIAGTESDAMLNLIADQVRHQIDELKFFINLPAKRSIIQQQLTDLEKQRNQLVNYRNSSLSTYMQSTESSAYVFPAQLFDSQTDTIEVLVELANSLRYLPEVNAAAIANYQALINKVLITGEDIARKNTVLNRILYSETAADLETGVQLGVLSQKIEYSLRNIVLLTKSSENVTRLLPIAKNLERFFQQDYRKASQQIQTTMSSQEARPISTAEWRLIKSEIFTLTWQLAESTNASIEVLAEKHRTRATRNLIIDVFLVFLCFIIAAASIAVNRKIKKYAYTDKLTKLPNRMSFDSVLQLSSVPGSVMRAVIFIDLDRFKSINDNYGRAIGDELLIEVADRLRKTCHSTHLLARLGGDEFAVFVPFVESEESVEELATSLVASIKSTIEVRGLSLKVGASAGISLAPLDSESGTELLRNADVAMHYNKANKLSSVLRFNKQMAYDHQQRLQMELDLKRAIENNEFSLVYQPKVCATSGQVSSVEALLRWLHPEHGFISPAQFIPVAEDTGLMGSIGQWVLNEACREVALIQGSCLPKLKVAVNISSQQFCDDHFIELVLGTLSKHDLDHESLELEITESLIMTDIDRVISLLELLKDAGISIAIDDFGTGYSSLQYLQQLPLNTLKIDRAFITALDSCDPTNSVANSIVQLAKLFNLETVAEGVETDEQDNKIKLLGVHYIQGFLYSKPVPACDLPATVQRISEQLDVQSSFNHRRSA